MERSRIHNNHYKFYGLLGVAMYVSYTFRSLYKEDCNLEFKRFDIDEHIKLY